METLSNTGASLETVSKRAITGSQTPRKAPQLDVASWIAVAAFVAYIGIGILA